MLEFVQALAYWTLACSNRVYAACLAIATIAEWDLMHFPSIAIAKIRRGIYPYPDLHRLELTSNSSYPKQFRQFEFI